MDNLFECLWVRITTQNSSFNIAVVYHPPEDDYDANDLVDFLTESSEQLLTENPNAKIIITGDLNKLNIYNLLDQLSFVQLVKSPTRGVNVLDVFITNVPHYWKNVKVINSLLRSDHKAIIAYTRDSIKACRTDSFFRDTREHRKLNMFKELESIDWQKTIEYGLTPDAMTKTFNESIWPRFESSFPLIKVRTSSRGPMFMSALVKHLLKKNKKAVARRDEETTLPLQNQFNTLTRANQLNAVQCEHRTQKTGTKNGGKMTTISLERKIKIYLLALS